MYAIAACGLSAFCFCYFLTPLVRDGFLRLRIVDHPDGDRKLHGVATPRVGGVALGASYAAALGLLFLFHPQGRALYTQHRSLLLMFLPGTAVIFATGLLDDLLTLKPWQKLLGQSLAAALAVSFGAGSAQHSGSFAWLPIPISFVWLLVCSNAFNLIDGMDGLASGIALFATASITVVAIVDGHQGLAIAAVPLAACLLAFLRYNFAPASIFLGDCGSLTLGFLLGCFGIVWSHRAGTVPGMLAPVVALALPLVDVLLTIGRRLVRGTPLFRGDSGHIHHMVRARMRTRHAAVLMLYGVCGVVSIFALMLSFNPARYVWPLLALFLYFAFLTVRSLNYVEFAAVERSLSRRAFWSAARREICLIEIEQAFERAETMEEMWEVAVSFSHRLRLSTVRMTLPGWELFEVAYPEDRALNGSTWELTVSLQDGGSLSIVGSTAGLSWHPGSALLEQMRLGVERIGYADRWDVEEAEPSLSYSGAA